MDLHQGLPTGSTLEALPTAGTLLTRDLTLFTRSLQVHCAHLDASKKLAQKGGERLVCFVALRYLEVLGKLDGMIFPFIFVAMILEIESLRQQYPASSCCPWPQDMGWLRCVAMVGLVPVREIDFGQINKKSNNV